MVEDDFQEHDPMINEILIHRLTNRYNKLTTDRSMSTRMQHNATKIPLDRTKKPNFAFITGV